MKYSEVYSSFYENMPENLVNLSNNWHNQMIQVINNLVKNGELNEKPMTDFEIRFVLHQFAIMDSNNCSSKVGMGEREARVKSSLLQSRYYGLFHGMGRSGNLLEIQPKAPGSTIL